MEELHARTEEARVLRDKSVDELCGNLALSVVDQSLDRWVGVGWVVAGWGAAPLHWRGHNLAGPSRWDGLGEMNIYIIRVCFPLLSSDLSRTRRRCSRVRRGGGSLEPTHSPAPAMVCVCDSRGPAPQRWAFQHRRRACVFARMRQREYLCRKYSQAGPVEGARQRCLRVRLCAQADGTRRMLCGPGRGPWARTVCAGHMRRIMT